MLKIHQNVEKIRTATGISLNEVCMKLPILAVDLDGAVQRSKRSPAGQDTAQIDEWGDFKDGFDDLRSKTDEVDFDAIAKYFFHLRSTFRLDVKR